MLRACGSVAIIVILTTALFPVQLAAVALRRPSRRFIPQFYHRILCALMGVRIHVSGTPSTQAGLIVSNHCSWIDISVISTVLPAVFIAKSDIAGWPLFGLLAKLQQSIFVDRQRRSKTGDVNREIARRIDDGKSVVLFAEGTSSDGNRVLAFRSALVGATGCALSDNQAQRRVLIQPLSIAYTGYQGLPMGRQHRGMAAWYGASELIPHLLRVLCNGGIDVTLTWGEPVRVVAGSDRKVVAKSLETSVRQMTSIALRQRSKPRRLPFFKPIGATAWIPDPMPGTASLPKTYRGT